MAAANKENLPPASTPKRHNDSLTMRQFLKRCRNQGSQADPSPLSLEKFLAKTSDHRAISAVFAPVGSRLQQDKRVSRFRFEKIWLSDSQSKDIIASCWNTSSAINPIQAVISNLALNTLKPISQIPLTPPPLRSFPLLSVRDFTEREREQNKVFIMSLVANEEFQHILRVLNTNVDGKQKIMFALTSIKGIGRRFANLVCKKADVDMNKRAGELSAQELDNLMVIVANPRQFKIPDWFLNRKKDYKDGKYSQVVSNALDMKLRDDLERLKKIRNHRGLRHYWGLRVRGQHTKTTGRRGKTVGVSKKR
ncbi:hypothetical protein G4B88_003032 [Cannabis sativa]|uniref:40S ribosomal protein S18 n=2 Tax=Cannabis sativa TaxID=3483 RepID=A0A7J6E404_CANSA|nr:hypothetical protein G4B88_003032 [Cannabis sativa]